MIKWLICLLLLAGTSSVAQTTDETAIRGILNRQTLAWNKGDKEGFMEGYWKNDSLMFIGKSGITYGWDKTLANYKNNYPDTNVNLLTDDFLHSQFWALVNKRGEVKKVYDGLKQTEIDAMMKQINKLLKE